MFVPLIKTKIAKFCVLNLKITQSHIILGVFGYALLNFDSFIFCSIIRNLNHSSEKICLGLMKSSSKILQNLPYFKDTKTQSCFFHFAFRANLFFSLMNDLVYDVNRPGHSLRKKIKQHEMKNKKSMWVFVFQKYGKF